METDPEEFIGPRFFSADNVEALGGGMGVKLTIISEDASMSIVFTAAEAEQVWQAVQRRAWHAELVNDERHLDRSRSKE